MNVTGPAADAADAVNAKPATSTAVIANARSDKRLAPVVTDSFVPIFPS
jgi:hypothetical protein